MFTFNTPIQFANAFHTFELNPGHELRINNTHNLFEDVESPIVLPIPQSGLKRLHYLLNKITHLAAANIQLSNPDGDEIKFKEEENSITVSCSGRLRLVKEYTDIHTRLTDLFRMMAYSETKKISLHPEQKLVIYGLSPDETTERMIERSPPGYNIYICNDAIEEVKVSYLGMREIRAFELSSENVVHIHMEPSQMYPTMGSFKERMLFKPTMDDRTGIFLGWRVKDLSPEEILSLPFVDINKQIVFSDGELRLVDAKEITIDGYTIANLMFARQMTKFTIPAQTALKIVGVVGDLSKWLSSAIPIGYELDLYTHRGSIQMDGTITFPSGSDITFILTPDSLEKVTKLVISKASTMLQNELLEGDIDSYTQLIYHIFCELTINRVYKWRYFPPELLTSFTPNSISKLIRIEKRIQSAVSAIKSDPKLLKEFTAIITKTPEEFAKIEKDKLSPAVETLHTYFLNMANSEFQSSFLKEVLPKVLKNFE